MMFFSNMIALSFILFHFLVFLPRVFDAVTLMLLYATLFSTVLTQIMLILFWFAYILSEPYYTLKEEYCASY